MVWYYQIEFSSNHHFINLKVIPKKKTEKIEETNNKTIAKLIFKKKQVRVGALNRVCYPDLTPFF